MIRNYLITAVRNLLRHPFFSLINIFALSISLSFCLIAITIIKGQYDYDAFHKDKNQIYRIIAEVTTKDNVRGRFATTPSILAGQIQDITPSVSSAATLRPIGYEDVSFAEKTLNFKIAFTNAQFFDIFSFSAEPFLISGSFKEPNTAVISDEVSRNLFGFTYPIGKIITVRNLGDYKITGIVHLQDVKTHLKNDLFLSAASIPLLERNHRIDSISQNWTNYTSCYTYVKLKNNENTHQLKSNIAGIAGEIGRRFSSSTPEKTITFSLQELPGITPSKGYFLDNTTGLTASSIYVISSCVLFLLLLTCFNYSNLTVARALTRTKEIGVRKVMGATRTQVFTQFIVESGMIALLSTGVACLLIPIIPLNDTLATLFHETTFDFTIVILFLLFAVFAGLLAGIIPSLLLSKLKSVLILKNLANLKIFNISILNRILTISQFSISCVLFIVLSTMFRQSRFMHESDYGYNFENIINIPKDAQFNYATFASEFSKIPGVRQVSGMSDVFGHHPTGRYRIRLKKDDNYREVAYYYVDDHVITNFGLQLLAGSGFTQSTNAAQKNLVVINTRAVELLGFGTADQAIGRQVHLNDTTQVLVAGVIKDFHFENFKYGIDPLMLQYDPSKLTTLNILVEKGRMASISTDIKSKLKELNVLNPVEPDLMSHTLREQQAHSGDVNFFAYIALMILTISCLGILGMSAYASEIRTREISIRKVLGAGSFNIFFLLTREFCLLVSIALVTGMPAGIFLSNLFLNNFAYKVSVSLASILFTAAGIVIVGLIVFGSQTIRSSVASPLKRLKNA